MLRIALVQSDFRHLDKKNNLVHYDKLLTQFVSDEEVGLIVFPEMFNCGFSPEVAKDAETEDGESVDFLREISVRYGSDVVATLPIIDGNNLFNRLLWVSSGEIKARYDKHYLFIGEEEYFEAGNAKCIVETPVARFLPLICFDVRFPEWSRNSVKDGVFDYDCLIYTANFPFPRESELKSLALARAIENQSYVLVVNRVGVDGFGKKYSGGTFVADPHGEIEAILPFKEEGVLIHSCDFSSVKLLRNNFPVSKFWERS